MPPLLGSGDPKSDLTFKSLPGVFFVPRGLTLIKFYMLITFHLCVLSTNSDLYHLHHKLIGF